MMNATKTFVLTALVFSVVLGCGNSSDLQKMTAFNSASEEPSDGLIDTEMVSMNSATDADIGSKLRDDASGTVSKADDRKIIYDTTIGLVVDNYQRFEAELPALVNKLGGFVANSETDRRYNNQQSGTWTIRVPVDRYSSFLTGVSSLGFAESRSENALDVTEEFVDLEARINNKRALEERIIQMLEQRTGKLSEALEIERELARVREEIERMVGRLRYLRNRTKLATVTIRCREQEEYVPAAAPTLTSRVGEAWETSLSSLRSVGESLVVSVVALTPWLIVIAIPVLCARRWIKRQVSRSVAG